MLNFKMTAQFRKDYKRIKKRRYDLSLLGDIVKLLCEEKPLPPRCRDHALTGDYAGKRECHITPDWLLIYEIDNHELILTAFRTGTHSDLFRE